MAREWRLKARPEGLPGPECFELAETRLPPPGEGEIRVRNRWLSVDPYMRGRMVDRPSYIPPFQLGAPLEGGAIGVVEESRAAGFAPGDLVSHMQGWRELAQGQARLFEKLPELDGVPEQAFLGALGMPGMTAWAGLFEVGQIKAGETLFVSGAAGAVGQIACQIGKLAGMTVIGSAGGPQKGAYLKSLGVDHVIDYRATSDLKAALREAAPRGIDVYFDNVGGDHLEAAIAAARPFARLVECGMIADYNAEGETPGPRNMMMVIGKRLRIQGFIVFDFIARRPQFLEQMMGWARAGQLRWEETVMDGIEAVPEAFLGLFRGSNTGKMLVRL
ncbi:MAG: NADP-dependent oxidoreductase [Sphingomonadaceae bacterium]